VALSLDPSKPASSSTCHPPSRHLMHDMPPQLMPTSYPMRPTPPTSRSTRRTYRNRTSRTTTHHPAPRRIARLHPSHASPAAPSPRLAMVCPVSHLGTAAACSSAARRASASSSSARFALSRNAGYDAHAVVHHPVRPPQPLSPPPPPPTTLASIASCSSGPLALCASAPRAREGLYQWQCRQRVLSFLPVAQTDRQTDVSCSIRTRACLF